MKEYDKMKFLVKDIVFIKVLRLEKVCMLRKCVWKEGKLRLGVVRICLGGSEFLGYM